MMKSISGAFLVQLISPYPSDAIISSKYCAGGVGDDCDELAQGNSYIKSLQEKSAMNREENLKVGLYYLKKKRFVVTMEHTLT
jgi:hypothetical protein